MQEFRCEILCLLLIILLVHLNWRAELNSQFTSHSNWTKNYMKSWGQQRWNSSLEFLPFWMFQMLNKNLYSYLVSMLTITLFRLNTSKNNFMFYIYVYIWCENKNSSCVWFKPERFPKQLALHGSPSRKNTKEILPLQSSKFLNVAQCPDGDWWQVVILRGQYWHHHCVIFPSVRQAVILTAPSENLPTTANWVVQLA